MTVSVPNLPMSFSPTSAAAAVQGMMMKNGYDAWFYDYVAATLSQITDVNFPGYHTYPVTLTSVGTVATATCQSKSITSISSTPQLATATTAAAHGLTTGDVVRIANANGTDIVISSLTELNGTATATTVTAHGYTTGDTVAVTGAAPTDYNGTWVVTVTGANTFTYPLNSSKVSSPATNLTPLVPATDTDPAIPAIPILVTKVVKQTITALSQSSGLATATLAAHGFTTGNKIAVSGVTAPTLNILGIETKISDGTGGVQAGSPRIGFTPTTAANFGVGDTITIAGTGDPVYDGDHVLTGVNGANGFYAAATRMGATLATGTVKRKASAYNGSHLVTVVDANTFTFVVPGYAEGTAAGTINASQDLSDYTGLQTITVTAANQFTFFVPNTPGTSTTATYLQPHGLSKGDSVTIAGATPTAYNGTFNVTGVQSDFFTYTFAGGTSPATGTITATGGPTTVPGIVAMDSYFVVMTTKGKLAVSDVARPTRWSSLSFNPVQQDVGNGVAIGRSLNYAVALKEWSTEPYYDAGNATGSPLSAMLSGFTNVGCASGASLTSLNGELFWMSQTRQNGRAVHHMAGLSQQQVSTPSVDRVLARSTLSTVYSYGVKVSGHPLYILTLVDLNLTLVYDMSTRLWHVWSSLTLGTPVVISSVSIVNGIATVTTATAHGLGDADPVEIAGCTPTTGTLNGRQAATVIDATHFSFTTTATGTVTLATPTSTGYTESYFKYVTYVAAFGKDVLQHETNGAIVEITDASYQDAGLPVNVLMRTALFDGGSTDKKFFGPLEVIGDKVNDTAYLRYSGQDYVNPVVYRPVPLGITNSRITRNGSDNRRSFELRFWGNNPLRLEALEVTVETEQGQRST